MNSYNNIYLYAALIFYVVIVSLIGIFNRKNKTSEDYFLASRSLPAWLLAITFIASWWGGGSAIDLVDVAHKEGISSFWIYGVPVLLATGIMYIFTKGIRKASTLSQPELLLKRYDHKSSIMLTIFIIIFMTIGAAIQVIVIGNFFHSFLGVSYEQGALIGTCLVIFYSLFGGFKGVVLTDLLQFVFFLFAGVFLFILSYKGAGGFEGLIVHTAASGNTDYISFFSGFKDNFAYIITFGTSWVIQANVWQRISAAKTPRSARKMMAISFFVFIPLYLMVTLTGMFSAVSYENIPSGGIVSSILLTLDSPLVSGLIFLGLCSAIMSTMDSMFNTGALSLTIDIYKRYLAPNKKPSTYVNVGRVSTFIIAAVALLIGLKIKSVLTISWIGADFLATGAFIPLIFGFLWKRGSSKAAFYSMIFGLIFSTYNLLAALGLNLVTAWEIASAKQALIGMLGSLIIYILVSLFTKDDKHKANTFINNYSPFKK